MKPENARQILETLKEAGVRLIVSLPDSWLVDLEELAKKDSEVRHLLVASEGDGVAICGGAWLGGTKSAMLMENSGLLVATYALTRQRKANASFQLRFERLKNYQADREN